MARTVHVDSAILHQTLDHQFTEGRAPFRGFGRSRVERYGVSDDRQEEIDFAFGALRDARAKYRKRVANANKRTGKC